MQSIQVTIRDMPFSHSLEDHIKKKAQKLDHFYRRIQSCKVVVDLPQKHKRQGKLFRVRIDMFVPGKELVVNHKQDEDVYVAVRDAFHALERQLESYVSKRRGDVKHHDGLNLGYVKRIYQEEGYGFIQSAEGQEHYFSLTNICYPSFEQVQIGDIVHFLSVPASDGFQAHRVTKNNHMHA